VNGKILKRASEFMKELSNDNRWVKLEGGGEAVIKFVQGFEINIENCEFYWNVM